MTIPHAFSNKGTLFLLIDGAKIDDLSANIYQHESTPICDALYRDTHLSGLADISPWLIQVKLDSRIVKLSFDDWRTMGAAVLWQAEANFDQVLAHFRSLVVARTSAGDEVIFRFYDPEILRSLLSSDESGADIQRLMGPCGEVAVQDRRSGEFAYYRNEWVLQPKSDDPFIIQDDHLAKMERGVMQTALRKLELHTEEYFPHLLQETGSGGNGWDVVEQLINAARVRGLSTSRDAALYINTIGYLGFSAFEQSRIAELWQKYKADPARAIARIAEVAEQMSMEGQSHG